MKNLISKGYFRYSKLKKLPLMSFPKREGFKTKQKPINQLPRQLQMATEMLRYAQTFCKPQVTRVSMIYVKQ